MKGRLAWLALALLAGCVSAQQAREPEQAFDFIALHWPLEEPSPTARMCQVLGTDHTIPVDPEPALRMAAFDTAFVSDSSNQVTVRLTPQGTRLLTVLTTNNIGRRIAIVVDDQIAAMPVIASPISSGQLMLMPQVSHEAAVAFAERINAALVKRGG